MKYLNLYGGIGGNRKLLPSGVKVTAIELNERIAETYKKLYPEDEVIVTDAHEYLLHNHKRFDAVWSSPPCPKHSRFTRSGKNRKPSYPDMRLYEEIIFLKHNFKGHWVVENVVPYYEPLIKAKKIGRHLYWSNFYIDDFKEPAQLKGFINDDSPEGVQKLKDWLDIHYEGNIYSTSHSPAQVLRNCVHPLTGLHIFNCMMKSKIDMELFKKDAA